MADLAELHTLFLIFFLNVIKCEVMLLTKTKLDHSVDSVGVGGGVLQAEARGKEGGFEEQKAEVLDRFVIFVSI